MRSIFKIMFAIAAVSSSAVPAIAGNEALDLVIFLQPQSWVIGICALGMIGLAAGNGIGSAELLPDQQLALQKAA